MDKKIFDLLNSENPGKAHGDILTSTKALVDMSRSKMQRFYDDWDRHDDTYRSIRWRDKQDKNAADRKEPEKFIVPIAHAQIQTFVAFCFSVLFQREYFFELTPMGADASKAAQIGEQLLQRDLDHCNFRSSAYQFLLDCARFGLGITKESWVEEIKWVNQETPAKQASFLGVTISYGQSTQKVKTATYQGNKVLNISPYRFFPDPRLPVRRFQEGEFCASEDEYSYTELKTLEAQG